MVSAPAWDGTGREFNSWQCWTYDPCSLSLRLLGSSSGFPGYIWLDTKIEFKKRKEKVVYENWSSTKLYNKAALSAPSSQIVSLFWKYCVGSSWEYYGSQNEVNTFLKKLWKIHCLLFVWMEIEVTMVFIFSIINSGITFLWTQQQRLHIKLRSYPTDHRHLAGKT